MTKDKTIEYSEMMSSVSAYVERGWSLVPVKPGTKRSCGTWKSSQAKKLTAEQLLAHFEKHPDDGLAVVTGEVSGIWVLDVDGPAGEASLVATGIKVPETYTVKTGGKGGFHYYFQYDPVVGHHPGILDHVDVLNNGLAVLPPTQGASAKYEVVKDVPIAKWEDVPSVFKEAKRTDSALGLQGSLAKRLSRVIPEKTRNVTLFELARYFSLKGVEKDVMAALVCNVNTLRVEPPLPEPEVQDILSSVESHFEKNPVHEFGEFIRADQVAESRIEFLVPNRVVKGAVNLLAGKTGVGKSFLALKFIATLSNGQHWPDGSKSEVVRSLMLSAEDNVSNTLLPRLKSLGADLKMCEFWIEGKFLPRLSSSAYRDHLESHILANDIALVVIDPIPSFLGKVDDHRNQEVQGGMAQLRAIADRTGCAFLLIQHRKKDSLTGDLIDQIHGSTAYASSPRSVLMVTPDKSEPELRHVSLVKTNNAGPQKTWSYKIRSGGGFKTVLEWAGESDLTDHVSQTVQTKTEQAEEFLVNRLARGEVAIALLREEAEKLDISYARLKEASIKLGVQKRRANGTSYWSIPQ